MPSLTKTVADANEKLNEIIGNEKEFPNLAGHIFLQRLFEQNPIVFHHLVLKHNLLGKVYTPDVAVAIRYFHIWSRRFLSPENSALILKDKEILKGKTVADLKDKKVRKDALRRVQETIIDYMHARYNFFAKFSTNHKPIRKEEVKKIFQRVLIVITDSERILGIGDQGAGGAHISTGKLNCYFLGDGMFPGYGLPIGVDVGTNNKAKLLDLEYDGLRQHRLVDEEYYPFIELVLDAIAELKPGVVQFEDFKGERAWNVLDSFTERHPEIFAFNDDSQGTGSVVIAGLLAAERVMPDITKRLRVLFNGAGGSATGIAQQIVHYLTTRGISRSEAEKRIIFLDSADVLYKNRTVKSKKGRKEFQTFQKPYILAGKRAESLEKTAAKHIKGWKRGDRIPIDIAATHFGCNFLIGTSTMPGQFHATLLSEIRTALQARGEDDTILEFPLSNPTARAEILSGEESKLYTKSYDDLELRAELLTHSVQRHLGAANGKLYLCTGSPFPAVEWRGKRYEIGQCNNVFVFPGIGLALDYINAKHLMTEQQKQKLDMLAVLFDGARGLAGIMDTEALEKHRLYPLGTQLEKAITAVAVSIIRDVAHTKVTPKDIAAFRWVDSQNPDKLEYDKGIVKRAADFSLDNIRAELLHFRKLEKC